MRRGARLVAVLILLAACQMQAPKSGPETGPQTGQNLETDGIVAPLATEAIAVTPLDAAAASNSSAAPTDAPANPAIPVQVPGKTTPRPEPRPTDAPQTETATTPAADQLAAAAPAPAPPVSPEQALCEKSRGEWAEITGSTGHVCAHRMRDAGKACHKKTDCQGECLARSNTFAPIDPLMGCNDILQPN